jgi:hypothetical protein
MKTLTLFLAVALLVFFVGCEGSSVRRITANPVDVTIPGKTPTVKTIQINERMEVITPEGFKGFADVMGQIDYSITEAASKALAKELPVKPVYTLNISAKGEIEPLFLEKVAKLAKPNVWTFNGSLTGLVEDGGDLMAAFQIEGTKYQTAHLHVAFLLTGNQVIAREFYVDFHPAAGE